MESKNSHQDTKPPGYTRGDNKELYYNEYCELSVLVTLWQTGVK